MIIIQKMQHTENIKKTYQLKETTSRQQAPL